MGATNLALERLDGAPLGEVSRSPRKAGAPLAWLLRYGWPLAGVALLTWVGFHLHLTVAASGFSYLILVVITAVTAGFWEATAASLASVVCLDYFFTPPLFSFDVDDLRNLVELGAFEFTALVLSRLSQRAQARTAEAIAARRDAERLYHASRDILLHDRSCAPGSVLPSLIFQIFDLSGVVLFDAVSARTYAAGSPPPGSDERVRRAYYADSDVFDPGFNAWLCVLRLGGRPIGSMALCG